MAAGYVPDSLEIPEPKPLIGSEDCGCGDFDFTWQFDDEIIDETPQG